MLIDRCIARIQFDFLKIVLSMINFVFIDKYNYVNACHVFTEQSTYVTTHETIMKLRHACDEMEINI